MLAYTTAGAAEGLEVPKLKVSKTNTNKIVRDTTNSLWALESEEVKAEVKAVAEKEAQEMTDLKVKREENLDKMAIEERTPEQYQK